MINNYNDFIKFLESLKDKKYRLLLHVCCFCCSTHVIDLLTKYFIVDVFYSNDNIDTYDEFNKRFLEKDKLQLKYNFNVVKDNYKPDLYYSAVKGLEDTGERGARCYKCYYERLDKTVKYAKENNYDFFTTTLSVSPYKNANWLNQIGFELESKYNIKYLYSDFKKQEGYKRSVQMSKELDLYRQEYCGCKFSRLEMFKKAKGTLGLALSGGGSKGSYQLGAIKALNELGLDFDIITGASIGSLNGYMYVKGDIDALEKLWEDIKNEDILQEPINLDFKNFNLLDSNVFNFLINYIKNKGSDISPFIEIMKEYVDPSILHHTNKKLAITVTSFPDFRGENIILNDVDTYLVKEYLIASSSCFPLFPVHNIGNRKYIDGGYSDNLPINLNFSLGATKVVAIDLLDFGTHREYFKDQRVIYIIPKYSLGSFFNFNVDIKETNKFLGYTDTKKAFGFLLGFRFTFNLTHKFNEAASLFCLENTHLLEKYNKHFLSIIKTKDYLSDLDYFISFIEEIASYLKISYVKIYEIADFINLIIQQEEKIKSYKYKEIYSKIKPYLNETRNS